MSIYAKVTGVRFMHAILPFIIILKAVENQNSFA